MPQQQSPEDAVLSLVLPKHTLEWFDISSSRTEDEVVSITLVEKNNPPKHKRKLRFKGYSDIIVTDFPIRGKQAQLTFRRRYWIDPRTGRFVQNDIPLVFPGTKLESEFAAFLKDEGGDNPYLSLVYSGCLQPKAQRVREAV